MKLIVLICVLLSSILLNLDSTSYDNNRSQRIDATCTYNGQNLYGRIKFVETFPDIKVEIVSSFPDLRVKLVHSFPDDCGEWQIVENFPDLKVQVVNAFSDIKIQYVEAFPGLVK